ncbi:MAG: Gfo/Idh/MocA family oxidoreductase [Planctomycetes bacterium]|nr:Gfo/Idh/MocA family oxidoreductase [Planctomycetota bacterium]
MDKIRIGIIGLGENTRLRHVPGLRACAGVEIVSVCNRRPESTRAAAAEFGIPRVFDRWEDLLADDAMDAVLIGTWPYMHCPITLAALSAGKHVLTEARMAMNAAEARRMLAASRLRPDLVTQIVPSPLGLRAHQVVRQMLSDGFLGDLREIVVLGTNSQFVDGSTPRHWRQVAEFSGVNMLALGILHEPLIRWVDDPVRVLAQTQTFTTHRIEPRTGQLAEVGTPDTVHVLTELPRGARGIYHLSGAIHHGPPNQIHLYGSEGTIKYQFAPEDRLLAARRGEPEFREVEVPAALAGGWRVEQEFVAAIRGQEKVRFTDFATGVRYMEFTEAVAASARTGKAVSLDGGIHG